MIIRNKKTGAIIEIRSNAHNQSLVIEYAHKHKDEECTSKIIANEYDKEPSGILQAMKKLMELDVLGGYLGKAEHGPMYNPELQMIFTKKIIEELQEKWRKSGISEEEIIERTEKLLDESIAFQPPDQWKMQWNSQWELIRVS